MNNHALSSWPWSFVWVFLFPSKCLLQVITYGNSFKSLYVVNRNEKKRLVLLTLEPEYLNEFLILFCSTSRAGKKYQFNKTAYRQAATEISLNLPELLWEQTTAVSLESANLGLQNMASASIVLTMIWKRSGLAALTALFLGKCTGWTEQNPLGNVLSHRKKKKPT